MDKKKKKKNLNADIISVYYINLQSSIGSLSEIYDSRLVL